MLDFNTKKAVLRRLRTKRNNNKALWLPCVIAELCVKLWYTVLTGLELALSGKNGKLFGFISAEKEPAARRQDDIVYVKRPFFGRMLSAVLAASLALMFMPELFPEMDIGITASAIIRPNETLQVNDENGNPVLYSRVPSMSGDYYYKYEEYNAALANAVDESTLSVIPAFGCAKLTWAPIVAGVSNYRYKVGFVENGATDSCTIVSQTNYTFERLNTNGTFSFYARPVTAIDYFQFVREQIVDSSGQPILDPSGNPTYEERMEYVGRKDIDGVAAVKGPVPRPDIHIEGVPRPTVELIPNSSSVRITWDYASAHDTTADRNPPMGYSVYRCALNTRTGNYGNWEVIRIDNQTCFDPQAYPSGVTDTSATPGGQYKYLLFAYSDLFENRFVPYAENKNGIIKSATPGGAGAEQQSLPVAIPPAPVSDVSVTSNKKDTLTIKWTGPYGNVDGYYVQRSENTTPDDLRAAMEALGTSSEYYDSETGTYKFYKYVIDHTRQVKNVTSGTQTSCTDPLNPGDLNNALSNETRYYYYVIPYVNMNSTVSEKLFGSVGDGWGQLGASLSKPQSLVATTKDGEVNLKWNAVPGADGYRVYITKTANYNGSNTGVGETYTDDVKQNSYDHIGLYNNDVYSYYVKAFINVGSTNPEDPTKLFSPKSDTREIKVGEQFTTPQDLKLSTKDGEVRVDWSQVQGAKKYVLYYKKSTDSVWETVELTRPGFDHKGLHNGESWSYKVVAYKTVNGVDVPSKESITASIIVGVPLDAPKDFTGTASDGKVDLKWTAVKGADGYILEITAADGTKKYIDISGNKTSYTHTGIKNGDRYKYHIQAYKTVNGERVYSDDFNNGLSTDNDIVLTVGDYLETPKDFDAVTSDGKVDLSWSTSKGAEGYILYAYGNGKSLQFDLSKTKYSHINLENGDTWTYYVVAYKTVNGSKSFSEPTSAKTIKVGVSLNAAIDLKATPGNRQIDLSWSAVKGAEGYVVYLYNQSTMEFEPITVISGTKYSHVGLKNGKKYTYMVAPFKTISGERFYGDYSLSVSAIPTAGSITDIDHELTVKGTTPYGISHSEYITANANHGAFDESVDVYFTTNKESTNEVKDVLKHYAGGLKSFIIYPFDISVYKENTKIRLEPNDGYTVTVTMPIPDRLIAYRDYLTVVHIGEETTTNSEANNEIFDSDEALIEDWIKTPDSRLQVLPCAVLDIDNVWCIQFVCSEFSPYAFVIYKDHLTDVSAGGGVIDGSFAGTFNSGVLLFTALPDILPHNKRLKVVAKKKRYRVVKKG